MSVSRMRRHRRFCAALLGAMLLPGAAYAQTVDMQRLVKAYPEFLASYADGVLTWKDGTTMRVGDANANESFDQRLKNPSLIDQMLLTYRKGTSPPRGIEDDPGRFRNVAFFDKMYGNCEKKETMRKLVGIRWVPSVSNQTLLVTTVNGVADKLRTVSAEIDALPQDLKRYAAPSAGTFNCRTVKDTGNRSMHAWGASIDLNTQFADYWLWRKGQPYRNRMPPEIVTIFEKHGFIWGGKWGHYDTMHFEYRPELLTD